ncbi:MAG: fibronectin, partial [Calditrichaeota bacterium]|nr:fibronectin [Calditrichota bacterium]
RIAFLDVPAECIIKIFTERGDLIREIEHTDGSGDEFWDLVTSSRQIVVSGIYIAYIEVTNDYYNPEDPSQLLYRKGDNITRKFVIIR